MKALPLLETCMEGGSLTESEIAAALAGQVRQPIALAIISFMEWKITCERSTAEARGQDAQTRTEACAASSVLIETRAQLLDYLRQNTDQQDKPAAKSGSKPRKTVQTRPKPPKADPG
jgi:hypothetical protein